MKHLLASATLLLFAAHAHAQWTIDGVSISTAAGDQAVPAITRDATGGWFVTWGDRRGADWDIYAQRVNAGGAAQWTANGVAICNSAQDQSDPQIILDDIGGAIIVWSDRRSGAQDIYAQHIQSNGTPSWTVNGVAICTASNNQWYPRVVTDGSGGAIITWSDYRAGTLNNTDIYAQRINAAGVVQWNANGVAICTEPTTQFPANIATDSNGGAIITWHSAATPVDVGDIYAQRVSSTGVVQWTANGVAVCTDPNDQAYPVIVSDGSGGAIIAWSDQRGEWDLYAQRINSAGAVQWNPAGVAVSAAAGAQSGESQPGIIPDGSGGAIIAWDDLRTGGFDVYAQRMSSNGVALWTADGAAVSTDADAQQTPAIVQDGNGGAIVSWFDNRSGNFDIYAQRMSTAGSPQWTPDGVALCAAAGDQAWPVMFASESGGAVVVWDDRRSGRDIYAQRIQSDGQAVSFTVNSTATDFVTGTLMEAIAQANTIPGAQTIRFDIPGPGPHVIDAFLYTIPAITDALTIDGFTQPGSAPNTNPVGSPSNAQIQVEIMGWTVVGLDFQATGTVRGVAINGFGSCISATAPNVVVEGNYIGTDHTGTQLPPFLQHVGVLIQGDHVRVGGATPASRNVILYGTEACIRIYGAPNAEVYGNYIGVGADAATTFENNYGVDIMNNATGARIGSSTIGTNLNPAEANLIMNCFKNVVVRSAGSINNFIAGNSMLGTYLMIDLGDDSYTFNDALDADAGPNGLQNFPQLLSAAGSQINGTMDGAANVPLYLHFYWSPGCCAVHNTAHYVGGTVVTLDANGTSPFAFSPAGPIPPGVAITATATDVGGNTSEVAFSLTYQNTGSGSSQVATLMSAGGTVYGTATYANVTSAGNTYTTNPYTPPVPVSGYAIGSPNDPQIYFNITTDASYTGGVDVCLNYDENNIPGPEANLVLLHYDGSMWANVTTSRDLVNNQICGHVTSLSPFVIGAVTTTAIGDTPVPSSFALHGNVPNPFNPITTIGYDIPVGGADVDISVFDVAGRRVRTLVNEHRPAGVFSVQWNGEDDRGQRVASGVYFYRMRAGGFVDTKKMVLLK